jgi:nicotinic acid mononucleotide adenylyltransferase
VVERPGRPLADPLEALPVAIRGEFSYTETLRRLQHASGQSVHILAGRPLDISSTDIRSLVAGGGSISHLVPNAVEAYIKSQRIYTECQ